MADDTSLFEPHCFVRLTDGLCHYRVDGPETGEVVLLIHGATVPAWQFDRVVPYLVAAGFRTLRADLFGHGYSDRPRTRYEYGLFVRQQVELLDALRITAPVHLVGHSLGAAIATQLACAFPDRVARIVLTAPLVDFTLARSATRLLGVPLLGELLAGSLVVPLLARRRALRYRHLENGRFVGLFRSQIEQPGFARALASLFRSGTLGNQLLRYRALADTAHPVRVLRGSRDPVVSAAQIEALLLELPRADHVEIRDATHAFLLTHPDRVAPEVVRYLAMTSDANLQQAPS